MTLNLQTDVGADRAGHLLLGDQSGMLQSRDDGLSVGVDRDAVIAENDAVVVDVLTLDELGEEGEVAHDEDDVLAGGVDRDHGLLLLVVQKLVQLAHRLVGQDEAGVLHGQICLQAVNVGLGGAGGHFEGVAGDHVELTAGHREEQTVQNRSLIVDTHGVEALGHHAANHTLGSYEALGGGQTGDLGEVLGGESRHGVGGTAADDGGAVAVVYGQGNVAVHDTDDLTELGGGNDGGARLDHVSLNGDADTLLDVVGGHHAGVGQAGLDEDTLGGGQGHFGGNATHERGDSGADHVSAEYDLHNIAPFLFDSFSDGRNAGRIGGGVISNRAGSVGPRPVWRRAHAR